MLDGRDQKGIPERRGGYNHLMMMILIIMIHIFKVHVQYSKMTPSGHNQYFIGLIIHPSATLPFEVQSSAVSYHSSSCMR